MQAGALSLFGDPLPPQSTSVSLSFFTLSFGAAAWQVHVLPEGQSSAMGGMNGPAPTLLLQTPSTQSMPRRHPLPVTQTGAPSEAGLTAPPARSAPPQSVSVSLSFFTPSVLDGA